MTIHWDDSNVCTSRDINNSCIITAFNDLIIPALQTINSRFAYYGLSESSTQHLSCLTFYNCQFEIHFSGFDWPLLSDSLIATCYWYYMYASLLDLLNVLKTFIQVMSVINKVQLWNSSAYVLSIVILCALNTASDLQLQNCAHVVLTNLNEQWTMSKIYWN